MARGGPPARCSIIPNHATGQPDVTCGEDGTLTFPGNAADAPGSASTKMTGSPAQSMPASRTGISRTSPPYRSTMSPVRTRKAA